MAAALRQFRIWGYTVAPTEAIVTINGVEVFNGQIEVIEPSGVNSPPTTAPFIFGAYEGDDSVDQTLPVTITVVSGAAAFSIVDVDNVDPPPNDWAHPNDASNDGRTNILINGNPPNWPSDGGPTLPGGTAESPIWTGWAFELESNDAMSFDYLALNFNCPTSI